MLTLTEYLLTRLVAIQSSTDVETVLDEYREYKHTEMQRISTPRTDRQVEELFAMYPDRCFVPSFYYVSKNTARDIPKLRELVNEYGYEVVKETIEAIIERRSYIKNLNKFIEGFTPLTREEQRAMRQTKEKAKAKHLDKYETIDVEDDG